MNEEQKKLYTLVKKNKIKEVVELLQKGVSPNFSTDNRALKSPLHFAVNARNKTMVKVLVEKGKAKVTADVIYLLKFVESSYDIEIGAYLMNFLTE